MKQKIVLLRFMNLFTPKKVAFTLVEVMVVMAIIAVLSVLIIGAITLARRTAINTQKEGDMKTIIAALEAYRTRNKRYPSATGIAACGGWEVGNVNNPATFMTYLNSFGLNPVPTDRDSVPVGSCNGYKYYRYNPGSYGCTTSAFYVLGISSLAGGVNRPNTGAPGWSCPTRNWGNEFDWVTGAFES